MKKIINHPLIKKGNKKLKLRFFKCWIGLHNWEIEEFEPGILQQKGKDVGTCNIILYYCSKCGKQKLVASEIFTK